MKPIPDGGTIAFGGRDFTIVLLVDDMPFFALQKEENLQTINLLLGYYTDGLVA